MCLSAGAVLAKDPLKIDDQQPKDFAAVEADIKKVEDYLKDVQCGGYNLAEPVAGKIATVTNVPGREGVWDGAKLSGMGTRKDLNGDANPDNDYTFPDSTVGLSTTCMPGKTSIGKKIWKETNNPDFPGQIAEQNVTYPHPKFEDPLCRWRIKNPNGTFAQAAPDRPLKEIGDYAPPIDYAEMDKEPEDRQSPETCSGFCPYVNSFQYRTCKTTGAAVNALLIPYTICTEWELRYVCTDQKVTDPATGCMPNSTEPSNARVCIGKQCRCEIDGGPNPGNACVPNISATPAEEAPVYYSYFRNYKGTFTRAAVPSDKAADSTTRADVPVACYGFYDEFDPKTHQTEDKDRRCVINVDVSTMRDTQLGKGTYGQNANMENVDPIKPPNQRQKIPTATDIWYMKLGWGFSLLDETTFKDKYDRNLSSVYLDGSSVDNAKMTGSWPVDLPGKPPALAASDILRSFDDAGNTRLIVSWWQKQQTDASVFMHPPVVRLLMPPGYAFGADPADPVFGAASNASSSAGAMDLHTKRSKSIEIQLDATEDTLGDVLGAIERSFMLHVEEEPVPVLVPMGSPTEFRAQALQWCSWYMRRNNVASCNGAPTEFKNLIDTLNGYADDIENVRAIRAELASYAGEVMKIQQALTKPISDWMKTNLTTYQNYLATQKNITTEINKNWRKAQEAMTTFQDKTNLPWCMNQRFETPIYSLLDNEKWLPSRADNGKITADNLPNLTAKRQQDLLIDFSGISYMKDAIVLPVLKPVQIRLSIPKPPSPGVNVVLTDALPKLPPVADIRKAIDDVVKKLPKVQTSPTYPALDLPTVNIMEMLTVNQTILRIKDTITKMDTGYDKFWKSIGPLSTQNIDTDRNGIPVMKSKQECASWSDKTCQHVEMDLMERFQRIGSRKLVMLKEDYESMGKKRMSPDACLPSDDTCLLLHGERLEPGYRWEINAPVTMPDIGTEARSGVRNATLPDPIGGIDTDKFPYYDVDINNLLPFHDVPRPIELIPSSL